MELYAPHLIYIMPYYKTPGGVKIILKNASGRSWSYNTTRRNSPWGPPCARARATTLVDGNHLRAPAACAHGVGIGAVIEQKRTKINDQNLLCSVRP